MWRHGFQGPGQSAVCATKLICWNLTPQGDGIGRWEMIRLWRQKSHEWC